MSESMRSAMVTLLLMFGLGIGACDSGIDPGPSDPNTPGGEMPSPNPDPDPKPNPEPQPEPEPEPTIYGTWKVESGNLLEHLLPGPAQIKGLILNEDKSGRLFLQDAFTNVVDCVPISILYGDSLFIDFTPAGIPVPLEFTEVILEGDELYIAGAQSPITRFSRVDELPADITCRESEAVRRIEELPRPYTTDLAYLDGGLYYTTAENFLTRRIDAATGEVGDNPVLHYPHDVHTAQPEGLWVAFAGEEDCRLSNLSGTMDLDLLDTNADLLNFIRIEQMAYDAAAEQLWIHGEQPGTGRLFLRVNAKNEPDVLVDKIEFDGLLDGLAHYDGSLWAIAPILTQSIVRIDPDTGEALASYQMPEGNVYWHGLTFDDDGRLYLLGETSEGVGVIVETALK